MKKKIFKTLSILVSCFLIVFITSASAFADNKQITTTFKNQINALNLSESDKVLKEYNHYELNEIYKKSKALLDSFNLPFGFYGDSYYYGWEW